MHDSNGWQVKTYALAMWLHSGWETSEGTQSSTLSNNDFHKKKDFNAPNKLEPKLRNIPVEKE